MSILKQLQNNKGAISSALGKSLAEKVLKGNKNILNEAVELIKYDDKNVRAGAAKIIEKVAEKKPALVAPLLNNLMPALDAKEPQTRWMIIYAFGYCAKLNPTDAVEALEKAKNFLESKSGACLWDRTILYLGYVGALSEKQAKKVFPILEKVFALIPSQTKTVLDSFERMMPMLDVQGRGKLLRYAEKYSTDDKPSVKTKALRILKELR